MPDYVDRDETPLIGATSELEQAASVEEESDLEQEQATAFSARSDVFAPLSRSRSEPNLSEQVDRIAALNGVGIPGQPGVFRPRSSSLSVDAPAAARDGQVDVAAVSSLPPPLGESGIEDAFADAVPRLPPPDEFADPPTVIVLPVIDDHQAPTFSQAVDRRLKNKPLRQIVVGGEEDEARLRERLAYTQKFARGTFDRFPNAEAMVEERWKGNGALTKGIASMEIDEIPIVRTERGVLRDLPEDSKLYINGHGGDGISFFQYRREDGSLKNLHMEEMAEWFDLAGLPRERHYDIRLQVCDSACPGPNDGPSMAEQFRNAMQEAGYGKVDISGYFGLVKLTPLLRDDGVRHYVVRDTHGDDGFHRRSENRLTFKADGSVVDSRLAKAARNDESDEE